ncbi:MAG TPA: peroxidase family protein, partial [Actinomycetota bacterium]|nr:peroxidase family protein [Actinomycetota bacterium]
AMGSVGTRFGRNVPLDRTFPEPDPMILAPSPRLVSRELLTRDRFHPATTLNLLAAAWIQFEVHDWFSHGKGDRDTAWRLPLQEGDPWPEDPMRIPRAKRDPSWADDGSAPTYTTADSHWWDGSQVYGSDAAFAAAIRANEGGKLRVGADGLPPRELDAAVDLSGVAGNFWVGLAILHALFMLEHNAICDRLHAVYPTWTDQQLYDKARLVNAALMAKIHTVEWTPAIIAHPTSQWAMRVSWWGLVGERAVRRFGRFGRSDLLTGIPGSTKDHHAVPYSLTEEFTAVYRLHPMIPDDFTFRSARDGRVLAQHRFPDLGVAHVRQRMEEISLADGFYSFGVANPGAIQLHNYPRFLQQFERADGTILDLAATDILRIRERGVPRYNEFRRLFHRRAVGSFEELTPDREWQGELRRVYGDVENVDLMVGLYAEPPPRGFGFSDTAFRVFALMAPRRLKSDRFFTTDYTPAMYTRVGLDWIDRNSLVSILRRHFPELEPRLRGVTNAFVPWTTDPGRTG